MLRKKFIYLGWRLPTLTKIFKVLTIILTEMIWNSISTLTSKGSGDGQIEKEEEYFFFYQVMFSPTGKKVSNQYYSTPSVWKARVRTIRVFWVFFFDWCVSQNHVVSVKWPLHKPFRVWKIIHLDILFGTFG
jgi:hypothetical protein